MISIFVVPLGPVMTVFSPPPRFLLTILFMLPPEEFPTAKFSPQVRLSISFTVKLFLLRQMFLIPRKVTGSTS